MSSVLALEQVVLVDSFSSSSSRELSLKNPLLGAGWSSTSDISSETDLQGKKIQRSLLKGIFGCKAFTEILARITLHLHPNHQNIEYVCSSYFLH